SATSGPQGRRAARGDRRERGYRTRGCACCKTIKLLSLRDNSLRELPVAFRGGDDVAGDAALGDRVGLRIADFGADARLRRPGAVEHAGFDRAARGGAAEQGLERLLASGLLRRARCPRSGRNEAEVGRNDQRGLPLHGELVGPFAAADAAGAAAGRKHRARTGEKDEGGRFTPKG